YLVATTVIVVLAGRVADAYGKTRILLASMALFVAASLVGGLATSFPLLVAARAVQGVGAAAMIVLPPALVREYIAPERIGRAMGAIGSSMATGMALGPALGGLLIGAFGWRGTLLTLVPLGLVAMLLAGGTFRAAVPQGAAEFRVDKAGLAFLTVALGSYTVAVTVQPGGWVGSAALLVVSALSIGGFILTELRVAEPLVDLALIRSIDVVPGFVMAFLVSAVMITFMTVSPFYLTRGLGLDNATMGVVLAIGPVIGILSGIPAGRLVDRHGPIRIAVFGTVLLTVASLVFATVSAPLGLVGYVVAAVLLTPGNQLFMAANNAATFAKAGKLQQGAISGLLGLARNLGTISGVGLMALLFDTVSAGHAVAAGAVLGLRATFAVAAAMAVTALVLALRQRAAARAMARVA
ncbi:MAG: MFS transporter, partial [Propionibacterium sp.]|nr:MFS transporter [Propionibacterium sp.]